jgi:hypothetical protein
MMHFELKIGLVMRRREQIGHFVAALLGWRETPFLSTPT